MRVKAAISNILVLLCLICAVSLEGANAAETAKIHRTGVGSPNAFLFVAGVEKRFYADNGIDALTIMAQPQVGVQGLIGGTSTSAKSLVRRRPRSCVARRLRSSWFLIKTTVLALQRSGDQTPERSQR